MKESKPKEDKKDICNLLDKSLLNMEAAQKLYDDHLYDSVCHPAYYACIQMIIYKLCKRDNCTSEDLGIKISYSGGHSHKYYINEIQALLNSSNKVSYRECQDVDTYLNALKDSREISDYHFGRILSDESQGCINKAEQVMLLINKIK